MKANSRRRVLISSMAMLLVALVALSTATFAWFTENTESYADGINVQTSKASSLVLSKKDRANWQTHINYDDETAIMYPASSADGDVWVAGTSLDPIKGTINAETLEDVSDDSSFVYHNELNIKNAGAVDMEGIKITFSLGSDNSDYARVALVPIGVTGSAITTNGTFGTGTVYAKDATAYQPIKNTDGDLGNSITPSTTWSVDVPDLAAGKAVYYDLFVWFEGQDAECVDANSGQGVPNLKFDVTGEPVD